MHPSVSTGGATRSRSPLLHDLLASLVVFLVALPLSLGIALASGAPILSGLIAAVVGGIVAGALAGAPLQVSGPAAGLTVLVFGFVQEHGFALACTATLMAGVLQLALARLRVARAATAISPAVIHGMLAGIGIVIVLAQLHVALGGSPEGSALRNLAALPGQLADLHGPAVLVGLVTLGVLLAWGTLPRALRAVPAPLAAVVIGTLTSLGLGLDVPRVDLGAGLGAAIGLPALPGSAEVLPLVVFALTLTVVASAESLLCAVATDKLHGGPRANLDRELLAQGAANTISGLLGGLPVTGVIVRSSANIASGARTRLSAILHGVWMLGFVTLASGLLVKIPLAVLAALLVHVGARLVSAHHIRELRRHGELPIYLATVAGVVFINLLAGIGIGIALAVGRLLLRLGRVNVRLERVDDTYELEVSGSLTFLGVPKLMAALRVLEPGIEVHLHLDVDLLDHAGLDAIESWRATHERIGGRVVITGHPAALGGRPPAPVAETASLHRLREGVRTFQSRARVRYRALLERLAGGQQPHTLFITCSDSRIVPSLVTSTEPGELFLVRNVGNLVPVPGGDDTPAEGAAIEYALGVLGVSEIVVCGHSSCGAMKALVEGAPSHLPCVCRWLETVPQAGSALRSASTPDEAARRNVLLQLEHLRAYPIVAQKLAEGQVRLHGWFYDVGTGAVHEWDPAAARFVPIAGPREVSALAPQAA